MEPSREFESIHSGRPNLAGGSEVERHSSGQGGKKPVFSRKFFIIVICGLFVIGLALVGLYKMSGNTSLVPKRVQQSVDFPVYYPASLPAGYTLNTDSFQLAEPGVVLFTVGYGTGKDIVFSEQRQPSSSDIDKFVSNYLPLNSVLQLPLGQAKVGAYGSAPNIRTILSLPIHDGPWLIITGPSDLKQNDLTTMLSSLTK